MPPLPSHPNHREMPPITQAKRQHLQRQAERLAASLPPLTLAGKQLAANTASGSHGRRQPGSGEGFWQYRAYLQGDPVQRIDWRRTARLGPVYLRDQEWQTAAGLFLWADPSASMEFSSSAALPAKRERAQIILLALAALLRRSDERVSVLGTPGAPPLGQGRRIELSRLGEMLLHLPPANGGLPYQRLPRFARVIAASDFFWDLEDLEGQLRRFAADGISGHLLQILDPAEDNFPYRGHIRFEGLEGEGSLTVGRAEKIAARYRARLAAHCDGLRRLARRHGWTLAVHRSDRSPQTALLATYQALAHLPSPIAGSEAGEREAVSSHQPADAP